MPNSLAVILSLTQDVLGNHRWNGVTRQYETMPTKDHDAVEEAMGSLLERVADAVNWPRLLQEAAYRHMTVHPDLELEPDDRYWCDMSGVCGECLKEALLADDKGAPDWGRHPVSYRQQEQSDWPAAVAANLKHRKAATWRPFQGAQRAKQAGPSS